MFIQGVQHLEVYMCHSYQRNVYTGCTTLRSVHVSPLLEKCLYRVYNTQKCACVTVIREMFIQGVQHLEVYMCHRYQRNVYTGCTTPRSVPVSPLSEKCLYRLYNTQKCTCVTVIREMFIQGVQHLEVYMCHRYCHFISIIGSC